MLLLLLPLVASRSPAACCGSAAVDSKSLLLEPIGRFASCTASGL